MATTTVVETYPNGDKYEGQVGLDGVKAGWGKYTFANGKVYEGHWAQGKMNGWGEFMEGDTRDRFVGEWEEANRRFGIYFYANGDMYQGGFDKSMKHGRGVIWENKVMYEATYNRDKLISKVPWKSRMHDASPSASASPARGAVVSSSPHRGGGGGGGGGGGYNPQLEAELDAAQQRAEYLEEKCDAQETQLMLMTKELKAMQAENDALRGGGHGGGGGGGGASRSGSVAGQREGRPSVSRRASTARSGTPTGRASSRGPNVRSGTGGMPPPARGRSATGGSSRQPGPSIGPKRTDRTSTVIYKKGAPGSQPFDRMSPSKLREEFRYYYNHFDEK